MSTPLKALIQERLRAKMVCRRPDFDLDDEYEGDSGRLLRQPLDVTAFDVSSRGDDDEEVLLNTSARGSTSRRSSSTQPSYPIRLHTHIDPSAIAIRVCMTYLPVPSSSPGITADATTLTEFVSSSSNNCDMNRRPGEAT
ncbi:hypothetical protein PR002_g7485 [Phytophthora rubi]|uniref:Uncharacterized protein n=1 Tax=Phytophthora rubi TaxID=129364 RepID=A0A6A3MV99_9STRA|nr:hypothetical protein PR002_g7485 [Phytophthora rubi]